MGRPRKILPSDNGIDFINLDVNRGARGMINIPCFYLDGESFAAPTAWLAIKYPISLTTRRSSAERLRDFLNALLDDKPSEERQEAGFDFWKHATRTEVEGYFYGVLREERGLEKTSILAVRSAVQSFYETAYREGWCVHNKNHLFDGLKDIEEETELILTSQYIEDSLFEALIAQLFKKYPKVETKDASGLKLNERRRFYRARDRLVMDLGHQGGLRTCEVANLTVEDLLPKLEGLAKNNKITRHIQISVVRKGGNLRKLDISQKLGQKIYNFIREERKTRIRSGGRSSATEKSGPLICSAAGERVGPRHGTSVFRMLRNLALIEDIPELLENVEVEEIDGWWLSIQQISGQPGKPKSGLSFHALRHTFLTNLTMDNPGEQDYVRQQAGHASKDTTFMIYVEFGVELEKRRRSDYTAIA